MKIENQKYSVTFCKEGGEICSFLHKESGLQYMYQGDTPYWSGKNPTLFPIVGNTFDGTYQVGAKTYQFKNHGLIRYALLECNIHGDDSLSFTFKSNEETMKSYPFAFTYCIRYTLVDNTLQVAYEIRNEGSTDMPFTFGLHPAFKVPLCEGESFEDYTLSFEKEESLQQLIFDVNRVIPHYYKDIKMSEWKLNYAQMESEATLIYKGMESSFVTLEGPCHHGVKMSIKGFPLLALWTPKKEAPFLCIEPWYSHADFEPREGAFEQRCGMMTLQAKELFSTSYTIEVF